MDVAEYTHVVNGPGVILVAHEGHWVLDAEDGKLGMVYSQRRPPEGTPVQHLRRALKECFAACALLEQEPESKGVISLDPGHLHICVNDRLAAPHSSLTFDALGTCIHEVLQFALSDDTIRKDGYVAAPQTDQNKRVGFDVKLSGPPSLAAVLRRLAPV